MSNKSKKNIFLVAGRTGGPYFPIPKIVSILNDFNPVIIGVGNSFEQKICDAEKLKLILLPEAKLSILSFSNPTLANKISGFFDLIWNVLKLLFSLFICIYQILKFQPKIIYTTGSFLAVPLFIAAKVTNFLIITNVKLVVHQQDPSVGFSNKICVKMADLKSCVFEYTQINFQSFRDSLLIENPIIESKFESNIAWKNLELENFLNNSKKQKLLIFGGGSGAKFINDWVVQNLDQLTDRFDIIHLTGILQKDSLEIKPLNNYFSLAAVFEDMPKLLGEVNFVLCRAGLGTISELEYLNKKAFLVPIPDSHQELNAELVKDKFVILEQKNNQEWLNQILDKNVFDNISTGSNKNTQDVEYYTQLKKLVQ
jgi:UDP-N-acetylglucosamine--N-acetylmuramyl-(pentapeptide) pyrophosphoryl-undecaprenol N-acetylglucosamine transferase